MATLILGLGLVMFIGIFFMDDTAEYFSWPPHWSTLCCSHQPRYRELWGTQKSVISVNCHHEGSTFTKPRLIRKTHQASLKAVFGTDFGVPIILFCSDNPKCECFVSTSSLQLHQLLLCPLLLSPCVCSADLLHQCLHHVSLARLKQRMACFI